MKIPLRLISRIRSSPPAGWAQRLRDYTRHHGIWSPGVRSLRNVTLRGKAAMLVFAMLACATPLAWLTGAELVHWHRATAHLERSLEQVEAADAIEQLLAETRAAWQDLDGPPADEHRRALSARETPAFERLSQRIDEATGTELVAAAWSRLVERRDGLGRALSAEPASLGELRLAVDRYLAEVRLLNAQLVADAGLLRHEDEGIRALAAGGLVLMARAQSDIERAYLLERELGVSDVADGPVLASWIQTALHAIVLVEEATPQLQRAAALGLLDSGSTDARLDHLEQMLQQAIDQATRTLSTQRVSAASDAQPSLSQSLAVMQRSVRDLRRDSIDAMETRLARSHEQATWTLWLRAALVGVLMLASAYLVVCLFKVLAGGLKALCDNVECLTEGRFNLAAQPGRGRDEVGRALTLLGQASQRLGRLFEAVGDGVGAVTIASREVAAGNGSLAHRTQAIRQDITIVTERANAFLELMSRSSQEVEAAVVQVNAMNGDARRARKAMAGLQERMRDLNARSREITQMVRMMESVAFQTRLLALNASVEAARAGTEGKGFAVVAQEVRSLAQRNEEAAQKIDAIVAASLSVIEECTLMTERAAEAVHETDRKIEAVHRSMGVIVAQAREGMSASHDVAGATRGVDESIDGNVHIVDQLSVASIDLKKQGEALRESVAAFLVR